MPHCLSSGGAVKQWTFGKPEDVPVPRKMSSTGSSFRRGEGLWVGTGIVKSVRAMAVDGGEGKESDKNVRQSAHGLGKRTSPGSPRRGDYIRARDVNLRER